YNNGGNLTVQNTILAGNNRNGVNCYSAPAANFGSAPVIDNGHNLGTADCGFSSGSGDVLTDDPGLSPLGNFGGPTRTLALYPDSYAIGHGDPTACRATGAGAPADLDQ